ncbi:hypothetical protein [Xenorhabdus hominickii]|uniref:Uncharacterized protein n=1 Tax=Xenorhabdus hominickii TaxID=351679 RepID=A0A1V0M4J3_XENHO|nr:hypothetical protein [Xenorhabdus hominickii]ARD69788.1 hypothetical protein [Xenorhabdus hominickii]PHM51578.1 hypothetical protein Xhom_04870 [Xenorhabdus hominickii]
MLDNEKQIAAFRALGTEGLHPPAALTISKLTADTASEKAAYLRELVKKETTYPASVANALSKITDAIGKLTIAANTANTFHNAINDYQSPSQLIQLRIGWTCYLKGRILPDGTPFHLIEAIADTKITTAQNQCVTDIKADDIKVAMEDINSILANSVGAGGMASKLTDKQTVRLNNAAEALDRSLRDLDKATEAVNRLATQANDSANNAQKSFSDAVSISIISGLLESTVMTDALKAITPASVISALS